MGRHEDDRESTFALDVDTGSFDVAQTFLANGFRPEPDSIRVEEWVNAFSYGDAPATRCRPRRHGRVVVDRR